MPSQTSILNLRFKAATFRISSGTSAWDAHTETAMVGDLCSIYWLKEYMARTNTAGETLDGLMISGQPQNNNKHKRSQHQNSLLCSAIA